MATAANTTRAKNKSRSPESYHSLARRNEAAEILQSYEMLSWWSFARCESLTQTRLHFQNIIAGFTDEDEASFVHWRVDHSPHPAKQAALVASRKGKERMSAGVAGDGAGSEASGRPSDFDAAPAGRLVGGGSPRSREAGVANGAANGSPAGSGGKKKRRAG
ncbi:hypothetical protein LTR78_005016 [Recurvomyces mirabilis]|uniref:Uncharacterized protein n=1 Tax=Recurvomyces mirabilis TaxID=574656 RepID=A0AAE0WNQ3_9PEZI|nr:hypothetical protein LTR78_005016 [Recurvomyces mirabilis]KAK5158368.1 hypothetical protein LTS14_003386 [Recurvomyces mirabilis]